MKKRLYLTTLTLLFYICFIRVSFADSSGGVAHVWGLIEEADLAMPFFTVAIITPMILAFFIVYRKKRLEPANQL